MNWDQALRILQPSRTGSPASDSVSRGFPALHRSHAPSLCVASGKGGTGKSVVSAAFAALWSETGRTLLVDADLGVGNAHLMQSVQPTRTLVDVVRGRASAAEAVTPCASRLDLLAGGSGVSQMASLTPGELRLIAEAVEALDSRYDMLVVDSAAGISEQTIAFASASDLVVIVTTSDPTAMTDAYAFLKVLFARRRDAHVDLIVNRALEEEEGQRTASRIETVCQRFLGRGVRFIGSVPDDRSVLRAVAQRRCVITTEPESPAAAALRSLQRSVAEELVQIAHLGLGRTLGASCGTVLPR
ncbi:MAG: P-loop NTPase [Planctomycetes bacterium]|nr:P-loop NTPase [Planctomycetota bacterium]